MENNSGKIIKITFEYENKKQSVSGEEAEKLLDIINDMTMMMHNHGMNPFDKTKIDWKVE